MASFVTTWNATFESLPPDVGEAINLGPSRIRDLKEAVSARLEIDHSWAGDGDDGAHKQLTLIEQASLPSTPAADQAVYTPIKIGTGTGGYIKGADGFYRPGLDGGVLAASDADLDLSAEGAEPATGQYIYMTPTTARTITLPTTGVGQGYKLWIVNQTTDTPQTKYIIVNSSDGSEIRRVLPGQTVWFQATQDTPTTELHWEFPGGLVFAESAIRASSTNLWTLPAGLGRAVGQGLRITWVGQGTHPFTAIMRLGGDILGTASSDLSSMDRWGGSSTVLRSGATGGRVVTLVEACDDDGHNTAAIRVTNLTSIDWASGGDILSFDKFSGSCDLRLVTVELIK